MHCEDCGTFFEPGQQSDMAQGGHVECPGCGRPYRSQPSGVSSDMDMRHIPDNTNEGGNVTGNPEGEGSLGGWQPLPRRDESFASVRASIRDDDDWVVQRTTFLPHEAGLLDILKPVGEAAGLALPWLAGPEAGVAADAAELGGGAAAEGAAGGGLLGGVGSLMQKGWNAVKWPLRADQLGNALSGGGGSGPGAGGGGGADPNAMQYEQQNQFASVHTADSEDSSSPSSVKERIDTEDPEKVDPHERNDGDNKDWEKDNAEDGGGSAYYPFSENTFKEFLQALPDILGGNSDRIQDIHQKLDAEMPGYLDHADPDSEHHILKLVLTDGKPTNSPQNGSHEPTGAEPKAKEAAYGMYPEDYFTDEAEPGQIPTAPLPCQHCQGAGCQACNHEGLQNVPPLPVNHWNNDGSQAPNEITHLEMALHPDEIADMRERGIDPHRPGKGLWEGPHAVPYYENEGQFGRPHQGSDKQADIYGPQTEWPKELPPPHAQNAFHYLEPGEAMGEPDLSLGTCPNCRQRKLTPYNGICQNCDFTMPHDTQDVALLQADPQGNYTFAPEDLPGELANIGLQRPHWGSTDWDTDFKEAAWPMEQGFGLPGQNSTQVPQIPPTPGATVPNPGSVPNPAQQYPSGQTQMNGLSPGSCPHCGAVTEPTQTSCPQCQNSLFQSPAQPKQASEEEYGASPDAGEVHILPSERSGNGRHQVMVIDHHGNSQWPTQYEPGRYGWDNPEAIVTPPHIIDQAHQYAQALDGIRGTKGTSLVPNVEPQPNEYGLIPFHTPNQEWTTPEHPDPWMDNEPGALTIPQHWGGRTASGDPTLCNHCHSPMTEPIPIGNKMMNHCTECGLYREVPSYTPLLQQQKWDFPNYPQELTDVGKDKERPWVLTHNKQAAQMGPVTPEQVLMVQKYLVQVGRENEVSRVITNPEEYANELAIVQKRDTPPVLPDNSQEPPMPQPEPQMSEDPSGGMPPPPQQAMASRFTSQAIDVLHKHFAADAVAPRCPHCNSGTTKMISAEKGKCHACAKTFPVKTVVPDELVRKGSEWKIAAPREDGNPNTQTSDQQLQQFDPMAQDSSQTWLDQGGSPLVVGQTYKIYSLASPIPDVVKITGVKPHAIEVEEIGTYGMGFGREIPLQEAQMQGLEFAPTQDPTVQHDQEFAAIGEDNNSDHTGYDGAATGGADDLATPHMNTSKTAGPPSMMYEHTDIPEGMSASEYNQTRQKGSCPGCGLPMNHFLGGQQLCAACQQRQFQIPTGDLRDTQWNTARTAGAAYTPFEQQSFIDEEGEARNISSLNLDNTHYIHDDFLFGL